MLFLPKGVRWLGGKQQTFCCPNCSTVFKSKRYQLNEPRGAVGMWAACHTYVKICPNCGWAVHVIDGTETKEGFK